MSSYNATFFIGAKTHVRNATSVHPVLYVEPDGQYGSGCVVFQIDSKLNADEQLAVVDRFATAVTEWRDGVKSRVESERTAVKELTEARAEIERLKAEAGETS
ncbi:hypothetical protein [Streptomyces sp. NBC_00932]|uniref:hypothetical protein n=1 Tax=Streptomyces sp. NBC_00932 TaxID=2903690 RepID=UPI00386C737E|nr:hypothetical protein OG221_27525 [Streptomyces sp. NBC_00932]